MGVRKKSRSFHLECLENRNLLSTAGMATAAEVHSAATTAVQTIKFHATGNFVNTPIAGVPQFYITTVTGQTNVKGFGLVQGVGKNLTVISVVNKHATITGENGTGVLTDTTPNHDQLFFTYSGSGPFTSATKFKGTGGGVITGGTGVLAGATGSFTATGTGNLATGTFSLDVVLKVKL
jgi:hypothetical protein